MELQPFSHSVSGLRIFPGIDVFSDVNDALLLDLLDHSGHLRGLSFSSDALFSLILRNENLLVSHIPCIKQEEECSHKILNELLQFSITAV